MRNVGMLALAILSFVSVFAQTPTNVAQPDATIVEPPTTTALGVEWRIQGDDNRNASVGLAWRQTGETAWRDGLPLVRLNGEAVQQGASFHYVAPNLVYNNYLRGRRRPARQRITMRAPSGRRNRFPH